MRIGYKLFRQHERPDFHSVEDFVFSKVFGVVVDPLDQILYLVHKGMVGRGHLHFLLPPKA